MDGKAQGKTEILQRIVALLLAPAGLAERAAGRSPSVRRRVLWSLWQADAVVRDFLAGRALRAAVVPSSPASMTVRWGHDAADAMALAASLRTLALVVRNMAAQLGRPHSGQGSEEWDRNSDMPRGIEAVTRALRNAACPAPELRDTS